MNIIWKIRRYSEHGVW